MSCCEVLCKIPLQCPPETFVSCQCLLELDRFLLREEGAKIRPALFEFTYILYSIFTFTQMTASLPLLTGNLPPKMTSLSPVFLYFLLPLSSTSDPSYWPRSLQVQPKLGHVIGLSTGDLMGHIKREFHHQNLFDYKKLFWFVHFLNLLVSS